MKKYYAVELIKPRTPHGFYIKPVKIPQKNLKIVIKMALIIRKTTFYKNIGQQFVIFIVNNSEEILVV